MKNHFQRLAIFLSAVFLFAATTKSGAFALLGPVQPWMQSTNGVINSGDIGGPMLLTNEYRWNVPVVTYGFDKSFRDYFGTNGVAAVESAIQILNNLPLASQLAPTNFPPDTQYYSPYCQSIFVKDLKSQTLSLLLEHLGLAKPTRSMYVLHHWDPTLMQSPTNFNSDWITIFGLPIQFEYDPRHYDPTSVGAAPGNLTNFVAGFNFDPQTLVPSTFVNGYEYASQVSLFGQNQRTTYQIPTDANGSYVYPAVADSGLQDGGFYFGLTYDDVGGLAYLLSSNNVNYEALLPDVVSASTNANLFVNGAWRPGVEKITFLPQPVDPLSGAFLPITNFFTDHYVANGVEKQQAMARIISQPDFLFRAGDVNQGLQATLSFVRTGTTNWVNNSAANGNQNGAGPGVIRPPVQIMFNMTGRLYWSGYYSDETVDAGGISRWASFEISTNSLVQYPIPQAGTNQFTVRMWLTIGTPLNWTVRIFDWKPTSLSGTQYQFETSTNLTDWVSLFTVTNDSTITTLNVYSPKSTSRFYRLNPQ
jgi:hypothetical protein